MRKRNSEDARSEGINREYGTTSTGSEFPQTQDGISLTHSVYISDCFSDCNHMLQVTDACLLAFPDAFLNEALLVSRYFFYFARTFSS
jgi:hypothetical protein